MPNPEWFKKLPLSLISEAAVKHQLDPAVIAAITWHESKGIRFKTRAEIRLSQERYLVSYREFADRLDISVETERVAQLHSWGLMQVMGYVARELGHRGYLVELTDAELGLKYGCLQLKRLYRKYGSDEDVISAYNQGGPYKDVVGMYKNQRKYVDVVCGYLRDLRAEGFGPVFTRTWNG